MSGPCPALGHIVSQIQAYHSRQVSLGCRGIGEGSLPPAAPLLARFGLPVRPLQPPCKLGTAVSHTIP
jgi:hypothetical protein